MVAYAIPLLIFVLLVIVIIFLARRKYVLAIVAFFFISLFNYWGECFCFGLKDSFIGDFKVLSLNVNGLGVFDSDKAESILKLVDEESPDVLFFTESFRPLGDSLYVKLKDDYPFSTKVFVHNVVFSKFPISDTKFFERLYKGTSYVVQCNISIKGHNLIVIGCHLSSNNYSPNLNYLTPNNIKNLSDICDYIYNVKYASGLRELEIHSVINSIEKEDDIIIMGDFNDVCGSSALRILEDAGLMNAWTNGGFGYGSTIYNPLPFRIDHIYYGTRIKLKGIKTVNTYHFSDHKALVAVFDFL